MSRGQKGLLARVARYGRSETSPDVPPMVDNRQARRKLAMLDAGIARTLKRELARLKPGEVREVSLKGGRDD